MAFTDRVRRRDREIDKDVPDPPVRSTLRASAQRLDLRHRKVLKRQVARGQEWQSEAWDYFDDIGEIKYPVRLKGNVMSKLRFYIAIRPLDEPEGDPIAATDPNSGIPPALAMRAEAELQRLKSPFGGRAEIVRMLDMNLEIAAECYLVCNGPRLTQDDFGNEIVTEEAWEIKSVDEVDASGDKVTVSRFPGDKGVTLDPEQGDSIVRIWMRHPRFSYLPDNALRGVLGICESLTLLENQIKADAKSHASAGILKVPIEMEQYLKNERAVPEGDGLDEEQGPSLQEMLDDTLAEPIENPSSASAVSPLVLWGPLEALKGVEHLSLARTSDAGLDARIEGRVLRVARGLNFPVETVLGLQQTTFANAAVIAEDKFKEHFEPSAVLICDSWTVGVMQPNLIDAGEDPELVGRMFVWFDPGALLRGAEPHETADRGWDIGAISDEAWRRVNGWTEDDAPSPVEKMLRVAMFRIRSLDPGLSTAIFDLLDVPLDIPSKVPAGPQNADEDAPPEDTDPRGENPAPPTESVKAFTEALLRMYESQRQGLAISARDAAIVRASATPEAIRAARRAYTGATLGRQFMDIDRELRTRLQVAAHASMQRAIERAGNRLKAQAPTALAKDSSKRGGGMKELLRNVAPAYAAATAGQSAVRAAGISDEQLIGTEAWKALEAQFRTWVADAQERALSLTAKVVPISSEHRAHLVTQQRQHLQDAWVWLKQELDMLAQERLYRPNPSEPVSGEWDPSTSVPVGLVRQALARAGGATSLAPPTGKGVKAAQSDNVDTWVVLNNGDPTGGVATGQDITDTLDEGGASNEGYVWDYGPAFRKFPFEDHEALDGEQFGDWDSDVLDASGSWVDSPNFFPGDHDGCCCDVVPIIFGPGDVAFSEATGEAFYTDQQLSDEGEELLSAVNPQTFDAASAATFQSESADTTYAPLMQQLQTLHGLPTNNELLVDRAPLNRVIRGNRQVDGIYDRDTKTITVRAQKDSAGNGPREKFSFVHEYGHALDDGLASTPNLDAMIARGGTEGLWNAEQAFRDAVMNSDAYQQILAVNNAPFVKYATSADETWARAYAQWSSGQLGGDLQTGLDYMRAKYPELQWTDPDFAPIKAAVENVLKERGLLAGEEAEATTDVANAQQKHLYSLPMQTTEKIGEKTFKVSEDGMVDVYHVAPRAIADKIEQSGMFTQGQRATLVADPRVALKYASRMKAEDDPVIMHFQLAKEDAERLLTSAEPGTGDVAYKVDRVRGMPEGEPPKLSTFFLKDTMPISDVQDAVDAENAAKAAAEAERQARVVDEIKRSGVGMPEGNWQSLAVKVGGNDSGNGITSAAFNRRADQFNQRLKLGKHADASPSEYKRRTAAGIAKRLEDVPVKDLRGMLDVSKFDPTGLRRPPDWSAYDKPNNALLRSVSGGVRPIDMDLLREFDQSTYDLVRGAIGDDGSIDIVKLQRDLQGVNFPGFPTATTTEVDDIGRTLLNVKQWGVSPDYGFTFGTMSGTQAAEVMQREDIASQVVAHWAGTSNDSNLISLAVQEAARETFGLQGTYDWFEFNAPSMRDATMQFYNANKTAFDAYVRAMYNNTQLALREAGYGPNDMVALARGQRGLRSQIGGYGNPIGEYQIQMRPMSSFAAGSVKTANSFGGGELMTAQAPASWIIGFPGFGVGCQQEFEVVVLGGQVPVFAIWK